MDRNEVVQRLRAWTRGVDAASGEPLPPAHALRETEVRVALAAALRLLEAPDAGAAPARPRPRNAGRPWSSDDDARLVAWHEAGIGVPELAVRLERTLGSITARLVRFGRIEPPAGMRLRR